MFRESASLQRRGVIRATTGKIGLCAVAFVMVTGSALDAHQPATGSAAPAQTRPSQAPERPPLADRLNEVLRSWLRGRAALFCERRRPARRSARPT